ncbi:MAG: hydrogenase maturation nickel metallochaperone HypA [Myxococcaceae bacterium]|nr:hydrogenase maturation nickel metallochaperone HypA [Myxococcaceae bacterium]
MHELAITDGIVAGICERVGEGRVRRITLEIGALTAVLPDAVRFCFDVCAAGTRCEGAELEIVPVPGRARCRSCHAELQMQGPWALCACGAGDVDILSGQQLLVRTVEVE